MARLAKAALLVLILVAAVAAFYLLREQPQEGSSAGETAVKSTEEGDPPLRVEEKWGFTSETVGP
jgi:hypothetical protein